MTSTTPGPGSGTAVANITGIVARLVERERGHVLDLTQSLEAHGDYAASREEVVIDSDSPVMDRFVAD